MKSNFSKNPDVQALCEDAYGLGLLDGLKRAKAIAEATRDLSEEKLELDITVAIDAIQAAIDERKK